VAQYGWHPRGLAFPLLRSSNDGGSIELVRNDSLSVQLLTPAATLLSFTWENQASKCDNT